MCPDPKEGPGDSTVSDSSERLDASDPAAERELRAVATLLRGLPDPEPPQEIFDRVMAEVARREARPRVIQLFAQMSQPMVATALAAGVSCIVLFGAVQSGVLGIGTSPPAPAVAATDTLQPSVARMVAIGTEQRATPPARPLVPSYVSAAAIAPQMTAHLSPRPRKREAATAITHSIRFEELLDLGLDAQLNRLLLDPPGFYERIQMVRDQDRFIDRLADRAVRRGDAAQLALRLRQRAPTHPDTARFAERFLQADSRHLGLRGR